MTEAKKKIETKKTKLFRKFVGKVIAGKMDKTIVVLVERTKIHPLYKKRFKTSRKYKVHDEKNQYKVGDIIEFVECRPISKDKRWRALKNISAK
ncbi:MAG: 30S ribosomal protein S17 [Patescibacteria group bacterium]|jgi:small subunit ribosomal protein S17